MLLSNIILLFVISTHNELNLSAMLTVILDNFSNTQFDGLKAYASTRVRININKMEKYLKSYALSVNITNFYKMRNFFLTQKRRNTTTQLRALMSSSHMRTILIPSNNQIIHYLRRRINTGNEKQITNKRVWVT